MSDPLYDTPLTTLAGDATTLSPWRGRVLLIVNVASRCGYTPQYTGLEQLWRDYGEAGLTVLGFPCNQFGAQEPGSAEEIRQFCTERYPVTFPLFAKVEVNGPGAHPLWTHLTRARSGLLGSTAIKWNFTKFLVNRSGEVVSRHGPRTTPAKLAPAIEALLRR